MGSNGGDVEKKKKPHLLHIACPNHGHLFPELRFTIELARRGITISFVLYDDMIATLTAKGIVSEVQALDFHFVGLPNPWGPTRNLPIEDSRNIKESFKPLLQKLLQEKSSGIAGPTHILFDMFFTWVPDVADKLQIPAYFFIPSGAVMARNMQESIWLFHQNQFQIGPDGKLVNYNGAVEMPGLPPFKHHELILTCRLFPAEFLIRCRLMCRCLGVVVNTFYELDRKVVESMTTDWHPGFDESKVGKVYAAGPLFSSAVELRSRAIVHGLVDSADECILWLSKQPPQSVLYVAFGTMAKLTAREIYELALGLEDSKQRFLWILPQRSEDKTQVTDLLPEGFQERMGNNCLIVTGWAPQLEILGHSATGGFLTHAGWNSCLESIAMGVPMVAWPQWAEQYMNCRYLMDDLKIAGQIQTEPENIVDRKEVERAVRFLMVEPEGKERKRRVEELRQKYLEAVAEGGSMSQAIDEFAKDIS